MSYAATWKMDLAVPDLRAAARAEPALADAHASFGSVWIQQRLSTPSAAKAFDNALAISPEFAIALSSRAWLRTMAGSFQEAENDIAAAVKGPRRGSERRRCQREGPD